MLTLLQLLLPYRRLILHLLNRNRMNVVVQIPLSIEGLWHSTAPEWQPQPISTMAPAPLSAEVAGSKSPMLEPNVRQYFTLIND